MVLFHLLYMNVCLDGSVVHIRSFDKDHLVVLVECIISIGLVFGCDQLAPHEKRVFHGFFLVWHSRFCRIHGLLGRPQRFIDNVLVCFHIVGGSFLGLICYDLMGLKCVYDTWVVGLCHDFGHLFGRAFGLKCEFCFVFLGVNIVNRHGIHNVWLFGGMVRKQISDCVGQNKA